MPHKYQDHYFHRAKKERYLARAVYKLEEIHNKYRLVWLIGSLDAKSYEKGVSPFAG